MGEMQEIATQLSVIVDQLKKMNETQNDHDGQLAFLMQRVENQQPQKVVTTQENQGHALAMDLFRIPDPIKSIPTFDGNRKQLTAWLKTAEDTLMVFQPLVSLQQFGLYIQAVMNKIEGKAKDILCLAGNPQTFCEIKEILLESLGDRQELSFYKAQLWQTKQSETMSVHVYFNKIKETVQNIKSISKQNKLYTDSWPAINNFINEDALAAFLSGLRKPYFGYAQAAKPRCIEEAYAFLCRFSSNEQISNNSNQNRVQNVHHSQKPNHTQQKFNHTNEKRAYSIKDKPIPMDVDISMRSRNTFNKKIINNHEILPQTDENEEKSEVDQETESEDFYAGNFQATQHSDTED